MSSHFLILVEVASAYNSCVVERLPGSADVGISEKLQKDKSLVGHQQGEAMVVVAGPITSRIQAIQVPASQTLEKQTVASNGQK